MSRNHKTRYAADQLPLFPKLLNGKIQRDGNGDIIYVDHFRALKDIERKMASQGYSKKHPKTAQAWQKYAAMVLAYDKKQKALPKFEQITIYAIIIILVIAAGYFQTEIQSFFK
jgi:hypothetical protein